MHQSLTNVVLHLTFSTKDRQQFIVRDQQPEMERYLGSILKTNGCRAITLKAMPDHVHLLFHLSRQKSMADVVQGLKQSSSKWFKTRGASSFSWQRGYAVFSVSESVLQRVRDYIDNQEAHHKKIPFQDELLALLGKHNVEYKEEYLWD